MTATWPTQPVEYQTRGVYYFPSTLRCTLAGVGTRGAYEGNRLALDSGDTRVRVDHATKTIRVENTRSYPHKTNICDLLLVAHGTSERGTLTPFTIHLKIQKKKRRIVLDLHRHMRVAGDVRNAEYDAYEVTVTDSKRSQVVFNRKIGDRLCQKPSLALRVIRSFMLLTDNLQGTSPDPRGVDFKLADLSTGFGKWAWKWPMARAELRSLSPNNAELLQSGSLVQLLARGSWELRITSFVDTWLPEVVKRDLFLFELEDIPLLGEVRMHGLRRGQVLAFRLHAGTGEVLFNDKSAPLPNAVDIARAYLEHHMLGGLLVEQAEAFCQRTAQRHAA